jgi:hypothetical protein
MPADDPKPGSADPKPGSKSPSADERGKRTGLSRRAGLWLTTVSTVVAVATGMFSLRDELFPQQSPEVQASDTQASIGLYQRSVGDACDALNDAEQARAKNERRLAQRLRRTRATLVQRNLLLDSQKEILANSEQALGEFKGRDAPKALAQHQREAVAAWQRIVDRLRAYVERLGSVANRGDLLDAVKTLPAMYTALAQDRVKRASGLVGSGGDHCRLDPPTVTPTITLRSSGAIANGGVGTPGPRNLPPPVNPSGGDPAPPSSPAPTPPPANPGIGIG